MRYINANCPNQSNTLQITSEWDTALQINRDNRTTSFFLSICQGVYWNNIIWAFLCPWRTAGSLLMSMPGLTKYASKIKCAYFASSIFLVHSMDAECGVLTLEISNSRNKFEFNICLFSIFLWRPNFFYKELSYFYFFTILKCQYLFCSLLILWVSLGCRCSSLLSWVFRWLFFGTLSTREY